MKKMNVKLWATLLCVIFTFACLCVPASAAGAVFNSEYTDYTVLCVAVTLLVVALMMSLAFVAVVFMKTGKKK